MASQRSSITRVSSVRHVLCSALGIAFLALLLLFVAPTSAAGNVLCVHPSGGATSAPCSNATAYTTIRAALAAAASGDEVRIAAGTYPEFLDFINRSTTSSIAVSLRGGYAAEKWDVPGEADTILDGEGVRPIIQVYGRVHLTIERMTIARGRSVNTGGGIDANLAYNHPLVLIDTTIVSNTARMSGGGVFAVGASTLMTRTQLIDNTAEEDGGGFYGLELNAYDSTVSRNQAARLGGGIKADTIILVNSRVEDNQASWDGGGLIAGPSGTRVSLTRSYVRGNTAGEFGGGIYAHVGAAGVTLAWSLLADNTSGLGGDALLVDSRIDSIVPVTVSNSTIARANSSSHAALELGRANPSEPIAFVMTNSVITNHAVGIESQNMVKPGGSITGDYNAFFQVPQPYTANGSPAPLPFTHLLEADPLFAVPTARNYRLTASSPLREAGDPAGNYAGQRDLDGQAVPVGPRIDIGAYEYDEAPVEPTPTNTVVPTPVEPTPTNTVVPFESLYLPVVQEP